MFNPNNLFDAFLIIPILNLLVVFYKFFEAIKIPGTFGFALIALTLLIRLILHPLTSAQLKSSRKLSKLKPKMDALQALYKDDKQRLHQEQLNLYKEAGINPAAGCLPLLLQMPILLGLYNLFLNLLNDNTQVVVESINKVIYAPVLHINSLNLSFFGLDLTHKPSQWQQFGWWLLLVPVITAVLQYIQTKTMMPTPEPVKAIEKTDNKKNGEDMSAMMQKQMTIMMPLMIGFFAYSFPVGLAFYWNTFTIFGIIQQYYLNKKEND